MYSNISQLKSYLLSEPHQIHLNTKFFKPSKLKNFPKHQICCRNKIAEISLLLWKHAQ